MINKEAQKYIAALLASQATLKLKRGDLEILYHIGYADGGLKVIEMVQKALAK